MCAPSPPAAPDYVGAAKEQGQANIDASRVGAKLNNPNVISPYGTQTVTWGEGVNEAAYQKALNQYNQDQAAYDAAHAAWVARHGGGGPLSSFPGAKGPLGLPGASDMPLIGGLFGGDDPGPFTMTAPKPVKRSDFIINPNQATIKQQFSPEQQKIYDQQVRVKQLLGGLGEQGATSLQGVIGKPLDFGGVPGMPGDASATRQKVIDAMMSRVNEDTDVARETANSKLIAAGIRPDTTAYQNSMRGIDRAYNDARNQAFLSSGQEASRDFGLDAERRRQAITELLAQRQVPLNEITALMSGSQVQNPFAVPGFGGAQTPQASPTFAAQNALSGYNTDIYNAQAAQAGNQQSGLMGLGTTALMAGAMM